jgi:UDP-GlcNAc:undecaprenyl-phosphate GlcNAc-1-phosphate transferase
MTNDLIFIFILIITNIIFFKFFIKIFLKLKIYDEPDFLRKIHTTNVPLAGGIIFILNNIVLYFLTKIFFIEISFFNSSEILGFLLGAISIFLVGLFDDLYSLKPNTKLILITIIVATSVTISDSFQVNFINFLFYENIIYLKNFSIIFTIFCFLVFLNAFNMMDGINGLSVTYFLICLIYLILLKNNFYFFSFLIIPAVIFLFFNFQNKVFLGDNGSLLLAFILSSLFIKFHNEEYIYADQIILLMTIPGIDMVRVAIIRILKRKHPFKADQSHLHHLILKKFSPKISYIVIVTLIGITALISQIITNKFINLFQIIIILVIYFTYININKSK